MLSNLGTTNPISVMSVFSESIAKNLGGADIGLRRGAELRTGRVTHALPIPPNWDEGVSMVERWR